MLPAANHNLGLKRIEDRIKEMLENERDTQHAQGAVSFDFLDLIEQQIVRLFESLKLPESKERFP